jgi:hypothetical protein
VVVVAGQHRDPPAGQRLAQLAEEREGDVEDVAERLLAKLDDVAKQDDLVGGLQPREEDLPDLRLPQDVGLRARAQV